MGSIREHGLDTAANGRPTRDDKVNSPLSEIANVLLRLDHVASFIANANDGIMRSTERLRVIHCIIRLGVPQTIKRQRIGNQIDAPIFARADFVNVRCRVGW